MSKRLRRFTAREDHCLERLRKRGLSLLDIAKRLKRGKSSIQQRLDTLAEHDERRNGRH